MSKEEFKELKESKEILEWEEVNGNLFGTSKKHLIQIIAAGKIPILDLEKGGLEAI